MSETVRTPHSGGFSALPAGTVLDRYRIDSVIAAGGFGITYLCYHTTLGKAYALKEHFPRQFAYRDSTTFDVRPTDPATFKWALDRFIQEGQALARCHHRHVVNVADVFEANATAYMVLGYEEGQSLKTWLETLGRPPTQPEIDIILVPMLDALAYVHERGLLHRDIAPDNVVLRTDGTPCLIDFGSARQAIAERSQMMSAIVKSGYSPPEQYSQSGRSQGAWSDIYAAGALLYRAVSGHTPPESVDRAIEDNLQPIRDAMAEPGAYRPGFLDGIDKALAFHYSKRPQTIAEWRTILLEAPTPMEASRPSTPPAAAIATPLSRAPIAPGATPTASDTPARGRGGKAVAALAVVFLLLGGGIAGDWWLKQSAREQAAIVRIEEDRRIAREQEARRKEAEERAGRDRAEAERARKAAAIAAQRKAEDDARIAREKAEAERAAALKLKVEEEARVAREKEAQRKAAIERAERERAERERAQKAAAAAAQKKAEDDARIAREQDEREKAEAERAAALKRKADDEARLAREEAARQKATEERAAQERARFEQQAIDKRNREEAQQRIAAWRKEAEERERGTPAQRSEQDAIYRRNREEAKERIAAWRKEAEDRERVAREKADAERSAALKLKAEEDARIARETEARRNSEERTRREQERERLQKAAAAAAAAKDRAKVDANKTQKAQPAKKEAGTNCPDNALAASRTVWSTGEIRSGVTVTARHPCGRSIQCSGGSGGSRKIFRRSCNWL